ncbi:MAG TPA: succinate dehydrogenase, hydrophobic membrane anchor protein [Rhizomicrobium sp.]|jgi:succinate dehydrogenase / fumarate reductase membrane anchor subunit|nr:succinate dehydrogenase, hydrophobic membrane anchor protein [Rhizomicrobium sp.]
MSLETPLHRVQGLGAAHSGTQHFWRQRITAVALVPLAIWFMVACLGFVGAPGFQVDAFFQQPVNAALMSIFVVILLYHMQIGLQSVIDDYAHSDGWKIAFILLNRGFAILVGVASIIALLRIAIA